MELILRDSGRAVEHKLKLSAPLEELLRRIKLTRAVNPLDILTHQVAQEIIYQMDREGLFTQLVGDLVRQSGVQNLDDTRKRQERDPKWPRDSEVRAIGSDSNNAFQSGELESGVIRSNVG